MIPVKDVAIKYATKFGFAVFPCAGKVPYLKTNGFKDASRIPNVITQMFDAHPDSNIGIATGSVSGIWVLDIDTRDGKEGALSLENLIKQYGDLPHTVESITWSGGRHIVFNYPKQGIGCKTDIRKHLDVKGDGGYIIAPPSTVEGKPYCWEVSHHPDDISISDAPGWLLELTAEKQSSPDLGNDNTKIPVSQRNASLASYAGSFRRAGLDEVQIRALLEDINAKRCETPLSAREVAGIAKSVSRYKLDDNKAKFSEKSVHTKVAEQILEEHRLIYCVGAFYEYRDGYYKKLSKETVQKWVKDLVGDKFRRCLAEEVCFSLQTEAHIDQELLNKGDYLNLRNGLFNIETEKLSDHSPEDYSTIQLGVNYNPEANCKKWIDAVYQIFDKDEDKITTLQEFFGYCLTRDVSQERSLWMLGEGANGKSTLLFILEKLVGEANRTAIPLEKLNNMHYVANLHGKLVNISVETSARSEVYDSTFKQIVSGDSVTADRKFEQEFTFKPFCKLIYALNNMPRVNDKTPAFFRRLLILPFEVRFTDDVANKNLKFELLEELDGIFLWCLEGLRNLRTRGRFMVSPKMQAEIEAYRLENNNILIYVEERCAVESAAEVTKHNLYLDFSEWCKLNGHKPLSAKRFGVELMKQYRKVKDARDNYGDRIWEGIRLQTRLGG